MLGARTKFRVVALRMQHLVLAQQIINKAMSSCSAVQVKPSDTLKTNYTQKLE
jgi:hypothetical protein